MGPRGEVNKKGVDKRNPRRHNGSVSVGMYGVRAIEHRRTHTMEKPKRSYYLPGKLVTAFDRECSKSGYVKEKVVAAAMLSFLDGNPDRRSQMFERLDGFL